MNEFTGWRFIRPTWRHAAAIAEWALQQSVLGTGGAHPFAATVVSSWWSRPGVRAMLLVDLSRTPVAYGEIWDNPEQDESELTHLLVSPQPDATNVYRHLIGGLVDRAREDGRTRCVVRVPAEGDAIAVSRSLGLHDVDQTTVAAWNCDQVRSYHWLEYPDFRAAVAG